MAFPGSPTDNQLHTEGGVSYRYNSAGGAWTIEDQSGSGAANLSTTADATTVTVASSTGDDAIIPAATITDAGVMSAADKSKLDGVAAGADVSAVDSVNGQTGAVVLDADDIDDAATVNKFATAAQLSKIDSVETGATADQTGAEIKTAYEAQPNTNAFTDAEKTKLTGVETGATADQVASEVPVSPSGNLTENNVQAALAGIQSRLDNVSAVTAENVIFGAGAPSAGLGEDGDYYENAATGDRYGPKTGGSWGGIIGNSFGQRGLADALLGDNLNGSGGSATTAARSDHRHQQSRGSVLPATDGTEGIRHVLAGNGTLPDGDYVLIGTAWVQS